MQAKVAIVTGAGSGIGRAVSLALLGAGYKVVLTGRRLEPLEETVRLAQQASLSALASDNSPFDAKGAEALNQVTSKIAESALVQSCDVTQEAEVAALFEQAKERFGRIDVLFNNAGRGSFASLIDELSVAEWREVMDVNINGMFICAREAFKYMRQQEPQGGRIINNGSISATTPRPMSSAYTTSKHAVTGLTKSIALDGRRFNIACSQIDIGNAGTDMTEKMRSGIMQANGELMAEPSMDVQHVAQAVLQMANFPLETNVLFTTIMATNMPFVGRG